MTEFFERFAEEMQDGDFSITELLVAIAVLVLGYLLARLTRRVIRRSFRRIPDVPDVIVEEVARLAQWVIYLLAIGVALTVAGVDVAWFAIAAIVVLVVAALVLRPQIENLAAGLVLTARPGFTVGDVIAVEGYVGEVVEIGAHSTSLTTVAGPNVNIPNSELLNQTVTVYTAKPARRTEFDLAVVPLTDLDHATSVIEGALADAPILVSDPKADVLATGFEDNSVTLTVRIWFPSSMLSEKPAISAAVHATYAALQSEGIQLATTDITVHHPEP